MRRTIAQIPGEQGHIKNASPLGILRGKMAHRRLA
jgi:hypothetical protein